MYPKLCVYLDGNETPHVVEAISDDFWTYEELAGKKPTETGAKLTLAYIRLEGRTPTSLTEVRTWAKDRRVLVTVGEPVDPTQPAPGDGS